MGRRRKPYLYLVHSVDALIQQIAVQHFTPRSGYHYFVVSRIPSKKDPVATDKKMIEKYGAAVSDHQRRVMKKSNLARVHYLRLGQDFVLLATGGHHESFWKAHKTRYRNVQHRPLILWGYSVSVKKNGKVRVAMSMEEYKKRRAYFVEEALKHRAEWFEEKLWNLPFAPYRPVREQLFSIWRAVNQRRRLAGLAPVKWEKAVRTRRRSLRVFEPVTVAYRFGENGVGYVG